MEPNLLTGVRRVLRGCSESYSKGHGRIPVRAILARCAGTSESPRQEDASRGDCFVHGPFRCHSPEGQERHCEGEHISTSIQDTRAGLTPKIALLHCRPDPRAKGRGLLRRHRLLYQRNSTRSWNGHVILSPIRVRPSHVVLSGSSQDRPSRARSCVW